jgi:diketogulonate reductase-like aldo/keto reductase
MAVRRVDSTQKGRKLNLMFYSPLGGSGASLSRDPTLASIGAARGCSAAAIALAWAMRSGNVIAIPESVPWRTLRRTPSRSH